MVEGIADYSRPRTGIISETSAKAIYGNVSPIGKILGVNQGMPIEITGIFRDLPSNTHLQAKYFISVKTWVEMGVITDEGDWRWNGWWNYIRIKKDNSPELTINKINSFISSYMGFLKDDNRTAQYTLQPLKDLHFIKGMDGEMGAVTNSSSLVNLILIAALTLLIAWINYVNLSVAHAQARSEQIRTRKLIGATEKHLWLQSLTESSILNIAALMISLIIFFIFKNKIASSFNVPLERAHIPVSAVVLIALMTVIAGVIFTGLYHGIEMGRIKILPGQQKTTRGRIKSGLVVLQMAFSIIFLSSTMLVYKQIGRAHV